VIKIGEFARLSHVSVVTLRHYDAIGLLTPAVVDTASGYRYYAAAQLPRLHRILALKDLGFSLEQIARILEADLPLDQLRELFAAKQAEVARQVALEQERLSRIAARLRLIELEGCLPADEVILKRLPSMLVAARRTTIPRNDEAPAYLDAAFKEALAHIRRRGAKEIGPPLAIWHQAAAIHAQEVADAAVSIDRPVPENGRVSVTMLPPIQVASVVHQGAFTDFAQEHRALLAWIAANGYRVVGPYREVYMHHDPGKMADAATEIQYPVAPLLPASDCGRTWLDGSNPVLRAPAGWLDGSNPVLRAPGAGTTPTAVG
jgi:DNA-binding transcriptional MerR regulator